MKEDKIIKERISTRISAVIFDMDGVIFDTERLSKEGFIKANELFGAAITEEYRQGLCGKTDLTIREILKADFPFLKVDEYRDWIIDYINGEIEKGNYSLKYNFIETIDYFKQVGCKIGLATSTNRNRAFKLFQRKGLDISKIFDGVVFGEEVENHSKPDPAIFLLAAKKLNVDPSDCCVVEDSLNGIKAAVNGGFFPIMVVDLIQPNDFCKGNAVILNGLKDITKVINRCDNV